MYHARLAFFFFFSFKALIRESKSIHLYGTDCCFEIAWYSIFIVANSVCLRKGMKSLNKAAALTSSTLSQATAVCGSDAKLCGL